MRLVLPVLLLLTVPALASSDAEWEAFRAEVAAACIALLEVPGAPQVEVNPFGSESYGVALITVAGEAGTARFACVFDKATRKAELSAPFNE